jgi:colicin import membrane protein
MKKIFLLYMLFAFSINFYAQDISAKIKTTKAKTETEVKKDAANEKRKAKIATKKKSATAMTKADKKAKATIATAKKTIEKAPKVAGKVSEKYNGKKVFTGPKGGKYYINKNGNKTYIQQ